MATVDDLFYKEFNQMLLACRAYKPQVGLYDIPLPKKYEIVSEPLVYIEGIEEELFTALNGTTVRRWNRGQLKKRKFDHEGKFIKKDDRYVTVDVTIPQDCIAIISDKKLGIPTKYSSKDGFAYVDMLLNGYCYIIPRKYCYKVNQTALVLSWNKLRTYYSGISLALRNGQVLYMYIIPYHPSNMERSYRVIMTSDNTDYSNLVAELQQFWLRGGMLFDPSLCELSTEVRGRLNTSFQQYQSVLDIHEHHNIDASLEGKVDEEVLFDESSEQIQ